MKTLKDIKMPKVIHLQTHLPNSGNAAFKLHEAFLQAGISSTMLSLSSDQPTNGVINSLGRKSKIVSHLNGKIQNYLKGETIKEFGTFSYPVLGTDISKMQQIKSADIIYIHWAIGGFLNLKNMEQIIMLGKPVIFFLHDMWDMTGGCHYSFTCEKYKERCNECQVFKKKKENDLSLRLFIKKLNLYRKYDNIHFIAPSKWLYDCANQSELLKGKPIFLIPNILNAAIFKPFDKCVAKRILNLDPNTIVISFGAVSVDNPYKGLSYVIKAFEVLKEKYNRDNITVLIFGKGDEELFNKVIPYNIKYMGYLRDEYISSVVSNASDLVIVPSLAEAFGLVVMESLSCGTPVVGFNVGGIPDMIIHKKNGYLSKYKDADDLADGINYCIEQDIKGYLSPDFDTSTIIDKHLELFEYIQRN